MYKLIIIVDISRKQKQHDMFFKLNYDILFVRIYHTASLIT